MTLAFAAPYACLREAYAANEVAAEPILLNDNGAWSWFEDERAIVDVASGKLLVSSVADASGSGGVNRDGDIDIVSLDINTGHVDSFVLHAGLEDDDHNSASLYVRPDGRYVAMYAKHGSDPFSRYRISKNPHDATAWEDEETFPNGAGATYSNLHFLPADDGGAGRLYNFTRTENYDPNILTSADQGATWSYGGKLLSEGGGGDRPYVRYFSDGDKIHFIATERHPRNYDNSIYHGYVQDGQLFGSAGNVLDSNLFNSTAVAPSQLTPVLPTGAVFDDDTMRRGWTLDVAIDGGGNPVAIHQARANNDTSDHRFFYSRWDGSQWNTNQLGFAGSYLYGAESDYTGLVAIDPDDVNTVYLSSEVHPATKAQLIGADGERHYELFRGNTQDSGQTWQWTPLTFNSEVDNLRPVVPKWDAENSAILWMRGTYSTYVDYDLDVVAMVNPNVAAPTPALSIDFGATGQSVQPGFEAFSRAGSGVSGDQTESYPSAFAAGSAGIVVTLAGDPQFRNRGSDVDSPVGDVVNDFVFANNDLSVTFSDLQAGDYQIVLYAHDRDFAQSEYSVSQSGKQLGVLAPTDGSAPSIGVASARYWFHADGQSDVVLNLESLVGSSVPLNGLELYAASAPFIGPPIDFNSDGLFDVADYFILSANLHSSFAGLTSQEAYSRGDINGDLKADFADFTVFRRMYDEWNGAGAFAALTIPEPSGLLVASGLLIGRLMTYRAGPGDSVTPVGETRHGNTRNAVHQ
ncbi:hypothetical protein Pla108_38310 [Botrimarina colliarenosi]|uniref:Uncharacterized protein n=2 Tax=Botrimarina colliarenosi TaxID=2528001 RepID=A0A5C6A3R3_9BACT|nr:hypothetical protein Pla108_38310 [Botrimarina colliarenosi]